MAYVNQHFVPEVYLQRFAKLGDNKKTFRIGIRRVDNGHVSLFTNAIDKVACDDNVYDDIRKSDLKHWEHYYSKNLEPLYGRPLDRIISKIVLMQDNKVISDEDKLLIGKLIAIQFLRMPEFIKINQKKGEGIGIDLSKEVYRKYGNKLTSEERKAIDKLCLSNKGIRSILMESLTDKDRLDYYSKIISGNIINVIYNNTSIPFCTSDNPVILYNVSAKTAQYGAGGIARSDTIILYPLSPKIIIQVLYWGLFTDDRKEYDGRRIIVCENEIDYVMRINDIQMSHAKHESYYPPDFIEYVKTL